ncbi:unnamed protein product [Haemonchus placei]|uniref:Integrase catalytic domain-containing protein n=1 Tax=Haemonchus placei TaxID=6290 RepID=A0A0N4VSQ2_HAEPC|nr:unnamed protein product [Haemonchus placei]
MQQRREDIVAYYTECNSTIHDLAQELKVEIENQFDEYWSEKQGEDLLHHAEQLERQLEKRLIELQCQEVSLKQELIGEGDQRGSNHNSQIPQQHPQSSTWTLERRLMGNELKVPNFYGNPSEFDSFWEMFEELVHHQPYSNIEKLSILINCCKGDAARTLQMIPRTGESYERAINQLKNQYQDPRRVTMQMIRKLKSMKQCQDDHRSLRNNLNDIQAIIATLERQGEVVDTINMRTMVLETFSKNVQDEMARKEFDSGNLWSMTDLVENLTIAIKRKEHVESIREIHQSERSIFHTRTTVAPRVRCTGCGQPHKFQYCDKYSSVIQKIGRLRELNACWKCFSVKHQTQFCRKQNCIQCGGPHNLTLCRLNQQPQYNRYANFPRRQYTSSFQRDREQNFNQSRYRKQSPNGLFKSRSYSPSRPFYPDRASNLYHADQSPRRSTPRSPQWSSPRPISRALLKTASTKHSPSPSRTTERQVRFSQSPPPRKRSFENVTVNLQVQESTSEQGDNDELITAFASSNSVRLMIVPIQLQPSQSQDKVTVFAILDSASDQSFISTSLAQRTELKIQSETTVVVNTFGGRAEKRKVKRVITHLYNMEGDSIKVELLTNDKITPPLQMGSVLPQDIAFIQENVADGELHLRHLSQTADGLVTPEILIGMDYFNAIMKLNESVIQLPSGLFLTPTFFGPVISGVHNNTLRGPDIGNLNSRLVHSCTVLDANKNHMDMTVLWKLNTIGIEDMTTDEEINNQIVSDFYSTVQITNGKIFVRFPWKANKKRLASNYNLALNLWKRDFKWDEALPKDLNEEWRSICEHATGFDVSVPRVATNFASNSRYELFTFVDASTRSFAAAAYLRTIDVNGKICSHLLVARQRLAPINKNTNTTTIPRLELLAILIGVRLTNFILQEIRLPIKEIYISSDSQVALHWVQSNTKNGVFVDNRCSEIRSKMENWSNMGIVCHLQYIPSEINPVDCATKGLTKDRLAQHVWWTGPPFLLSDHSKWPTLPQFSWKVEGSGEEIDSNQPSRTVCVAKTTDTSDKNPKSNLFTKEYSSFKRYKRILCLILKFLKHVLYNKISNENKALLKSAIPEIEHITADTPLTLMEPIDLSMTERVLIKKAQKVLSAEYLAKLNNLQLYTDENGVVRCRGRIQAKHLAKETQEPILLPENHNFTTLIIRDTHHRCGHQGINGTLANLRLNYWIPKGRQTVKKCLRKCLICKKWNSKPFFYPNSPPLPQARTEPSRPFLHVGIDLAGPFCVINDENGEQKRWVLLSTCMVTRAIHLEIVNNLSAAEFINGLRRFVARRGKPKLIISDNATNFVLGREIIETLSDRTEIATQGIQNYLSNEGIKWKFITPLSPWKGGFYERMIGVMKSTLKRITRKKSIHENEFITVIPECEAMVNSRPLTYSGSTVEDSVILRPIDFIIPYANVNILPSVDQEEQDAEYFAKYSTREETIQLFQKHLSYLQKLWEFWTDNYLLELRNFHQTRINQKSFTRKQPYIGEVVLVMDESKPRGEWPLGLVTKLIEDQDGEIRSVELKTTKSNITRSINLLIPLEIEERNLHQQENNESKSLQNESEVKMPKEFANDDTAAIGGVMTQQHNDAPKRTRPWLPRHAKEQRELRLVERRTFTLKEMLEESLDGLTQIFKLQKQMIAMLEELRYVPSREPSPQPGSSRQQPQQQSSNKCGFCDSPDHFAADCKQYFTLRDRSRRATERFRCERCLKRASHLATSCPTEKVCHYCKVAKREKEMVKHNSAFCPHKFPLE